MCCIRVLEGTNIDFICNLVLKDEDLREESIRKGSLLRQQILDAEVCDT